MTFLSPSWRSLNHLKGSLNHPKKATKNCQEFKQRFGVFALVKFLNVSNSNIKIVLILPCACGLKDHKPAVCFETLSEMDNRITNRENKPPQKIPTKWLMLLLLLPKDQPSLASKFPYQKFSCGPTKPQNVGVFGSRFA